MSRYAFLHRWDPRKVAILHKAGPSALGRILLAQKEGNLSLEDATCADPSPGTCAYLLRFDRFRGAYDAYLNGMLVFKDDPDMAVNKAPETIIPL